MFLGTAVAPSSPAVTVAASAGKGVPYLFTHHNSPAFRIRIPADLQPCLGKTEYRRSLGRCYASEAKLRALRLATAALEVFAFVREVVLARDKYPLSQRNLIGTTYEGKTFSAGRSTPRPVSGDKMQVAQGETAYEHGYTPLFQGRALGSLTDDEIRTIAETTLLLALKGRQILSTEAGEEAFRRNLGPIPDDPEADAILDEVEEYLANDPTPALPEDDVMGRARRLSENCRKMEEELRVALISGKAHWYTARATERLLRWNGVSTDPETENADAILATPPKASMPFVRAYNEMLKMSMTDAKLGAQTALGEYEAHDAAIIRLEERQEQRREKRRVKVQTQPPTAAAVTPSAATAPEPETPPSGKKLSEAIEEMFRDKSLDGSWKPKVARMERAKFALFQAIVDPDDRLPVSRLSAAHLKRYKTIILQLPANRSKSRAYRDLGTPALIHLAESGGVPPEDRIKVNTIKTYFQSPTAFLNWAATSEYHTNPRIARILQIKAEKQPHEERDPFTDQDVTSLFSAHSFLVGTTAREQNRVARHGKLDSGGKASRFWVPLLGLFTGARLEELSQLHTDDIVLVNRQGDHRRVFVPGVSIPQAIVEAKTAAHGEGKETLCLFINMGKEYQRLKTAASRHYVPLSPVLTDDLAFLDYVGWIFKKAEAARAKGRLPQGDGRLFPELYRRKEEDNFGHQLSKWFNKYRKAVGIAPKKNEPQKNFHSFRHTLSRWCDQNRVMEKSAARHLGHSHDTMTYGRYAPDTLPHILYAEVTKGFSEYARPLLDLEGLKAGYWAGEANR
ncbi:exported hypothetical protein [uncultured delta proteobacterium]|uniref:Tyr recombinase domain-containing protein n=1 Tax=uncultured delta proteobacterium TaxID=34034 RepID=A0A212J3V7_9DELT|nr:exported hypothetical protein [uncultured delta proteobacterium]